MSGANGQTITVCGNVFRLVETIGRGSYGTVHKAINLSSGAAVAVKLIGKDKIRRPHERRSIEKEIETMRVAVEQFENGHPHIVRLLCTKESQQHIYIVLEYCAGGDLAAVMKSTRGLTEEQARIYMSQLASGLQFLRSQNVVHRDLKPANLLLSSKNQSNAKLKIADFGFARELQSESLAESVVGSPLYMAPELLEYKSYDAKADLWSVGIILYEMLANDHPFLVVDNFHATNHLALRRNIQRYFERYGNVRLPQHIRVSAECLELLQGLLQMDPRRRISFEDFFRAPFLLPPTPTTSDSTQETELTASANANKQALVAEDQPDQDWGAFSDEYVIVDKEYEDVGRRILNQNDLNTGIGAKRLDRAPSGTNVTSTESKPQTPSVAPVAAPSSPVNATTKAVSTLNIETPAVVPNSDSTNLLDVVVDTSTPKSESSSGQNTFSSASEVEIEQAQPPVREPSVSPSLAPVPVGDRREWVTDDNRLEELLGICYKSFSCGSVGLFVPTPFGDYIAFHEGCPHHYLSVESIEAFKHDGRNPSYVLGCIVFIEDFVATTTNNPYCLREDTPYHVVTVTPLSAASQANAAASETELPLSQALAPRVIPIDDTQPTPAPTARPSGFFSSLSSYLGHPSASPPSETPPPPPSTQASIAPSSSAVPAFTSPHQQQHQRISFRSFQISHLALFFLKGGKLPYVAFNEGAPNYFLANESIQAARAGDADDKTYPAYILGEIIFIDTFQATEDFNPYRLPYGTRFHVVTVSNPKRT
ncbi:hypothetical protein PINS_up009035 [Pythium insidiosum]|nr:hypothetical protein PINS_up009035 [Pythium insidiosum]